MEKVCIIGSPGSGKSTLSKRISEITQLPLYHLDKLMWKPNWTLVEREKQRSIQMKLVQEAKWIIDGNYGGTMDIRLDSADTIIFLDFKRRICLYRVLKRFFQYRNKTRSDMIEGNKERFHLEFFRYVWDFPRKKRPALINRLEMLPDSKSIYHLHSNKEVEDYLIKIIEKRKVG